ncbi:hypothetical protein ACFOD9_13800 [Novosphingobium bradum]|uniref:Uncharacterized protein n=1 Tax=Novosphingobium bradum TaxID=1737444 RepID=A0ABV7ISL4_9SPHN
MAFKSILLSLLAPAAAMVAVPAMAQDAPSAAGLPTCSATVTDHCVQRGGSGHAAMGHHGMAAHPGQNHGRHHARGHARHHAKARHHRMAHRHHAAATPARPRG